VSAASPDEVGRTFVAALNSGNLEAALELWLDDAVLLPPGGSPVEGRQAIRAALAPLIETAAELRIDSSRTYVAGGSAVRTGRLRLIAGSADGSPTEVVTHFITVYARSGDGWRIVLDAPAGLPSE
jgi:uncharacterized protein (TIGR02246 family)